MALPKLNSIFLIGVFICATMLVPESCSYDCTKSINYQYPTWWILSRPQINMTFHRILRSEITKKGKRFFFRPRSYKSCRKATLLLPFALHKLTFPVLEILPNREICIEGKKIPGVCMPPNPVVASELKIHKKIYTLFFQNF